MKTLWVIFDYQCGLYWEVVSQRNHPALFSPFRHHREVKKQTVKHLLQSSLSGDIVKLCASSRNFLAQASAPLLQWKAPPLFKRLFDLIYLIIQNLRRNVIYCADHSSVRSLSACNEAGIFNCHHKPQRHTWN